MAFRVPSFPLFANIWRQGGVGGAYMAPDLTVACNLSPGRRTLVADPDAASPLATQLVMELLVPARTDIRATWNMTPSDLVEVPAGSLRFYVVVWVDDVGRGFPNEYRLAAMYYSNVGNSTLIGGPFPAPVPLN